MKSLIFAAAFAAASLIAAQQVLVGQQALDVPVAIAELPPSTTAAEGGRIAPDGKTEIQIDLPGELHQENISSKGLGCCVFRSLDHASRWQNVSALLHFPEWMVSKGIAGGGNPQKVEDLVPRIAADRGLPTPKFIQVQGRDLEILKEACKAGRLPSVTYSRSPTGRYEGRHIAHMVNLPHADGSHFAVLDNNYVGANHYEWMAPADFERVCQEGGQYWAVILLDPGPPPIPVNVRR